MASFKDQVLRLHGLSQTPGQGKDPVLDDYFRPAYERWLRNQTLHSSKAVEHSNKVFTGKYQHERKGRLSPSGFAGECDREVLFSFAGAPKIPGPISNEAVMEAGNSDHLRWQMAGLTSGFLSDCEGWSFVEDLRFGGSMDGVGADGSLFELKNTAPHLFKAIATGKGNAVDYATKMVRKHKLQMEAYWLLDELQPNPKLQPLGSLVYQDRASKEIFEVRLTPNPERRQEVHAILESFHDWIDIDQLPDLLPGCQAVLGHVERSPTEKEQVVFNRCAYRQWCPITERLSIP